MKLRAGVIAATMLTIYGLVWAQLPGAPNWRAGAEKFTTSDGVIYADGQPFLLIYDFTWSAEKDEKLYEFGEDWGNTATYGPVSANVSQPFDFGAMNSIYDAAALGHTFYTWSGSVAHQGRYLYEHPEAARVGPDGKPVGRSAMCFLNPGYREALGQRLAEVAQSLAGRPFQLGYYPQDEFAYRRWGCHCPVCKARFREMMRDKYETIAALNRAWGTELTSFDDIEPPAKREASPRFCDWQEFRRWSQLDFAKFVYDTLKENDPNHLVIWSLPFWGAVNTTAAWWDFPQVSDILMRHGIGYRTGAYRINLLRDVAEWSG
ncbi:MAG: beta-galactosidase, partial [Armatimonadetes bacterium]|nr:beta-galactosidase [Armatimonadota bacterium]